MNDTRKAFEEAENEIMLHKNIGNGENIFYRFFKAGAEAMQPNLDTALSALREIAETPDCLYKTDAVKMRKIAREALKKIEKENSK